MKFNRVSVLVPTRHRVQRLRTLLESWTATVTDGSKAELVFRVDDDDEATKQYLALHNTVIGPRFDGYQSMPLFFNELAEAATGDVLICGNDDMVFRTLGWPELVLQAANRYPDGVFNFGVSTHNEDHYPFSIVSKAAAKQMGYLWDPTIFWGDIFLRDVMAWFGRTEMLPSVQIDHDWAGFRPDQVFNESDKNITQRDPTYWAVTHRQAVENAVNKLRVLHG